MGDDASDAATWHRRFGRELFNSTWDLIDSADRTADDDVAMLLAASASRWHWAQVGSAEEIAIGDWQVAHVACLIGDGELALTFARRNLDAAQRESWDGWRLASAHEGLARAYATTGRMTESAQQVRAARDALTREDSAEDREIVEAQLATIPGVDIGQY